MKTKSNNAFHHWILMTGVATVVAITQAAMAAPTVLLLTPPSALFSAGDSEPPYISRFLAGQRFDLQAVDFIDNPESVRRQISVDRVGQNIG